MLKKTVTLPSSKSESARALMIAAYGGLKPDFQNLSDSSDTLVLEQALRDVQDKKPVIDIADCGTAARFLTTFLACTEGDWLLTGTERMKQRPILPLVDALKQLGAEIQYVEQDGFLPLQIYGRPILGGSVRLDITQSSQFASSLLLAAPMWPQGLDLEVLGSPSSVPYLDMTLAMMRHFGAKIEQDGNMIKVCPKPYQPTSFAISSDWTSASYWYEMAAFSEECEIELRSLSLSKGRPNLQGDAVIAEWMQSFGVKTEAVENGVLLTKIPFEKKPLSFDFTDHPDLYPTMTATCAGLGIEAEFKGLDNLRFKESDRVGAMQTELAKIGEKPLRFCAHNDHRIVMALAPLSLLFGPATFDHPEVVAKSYPRFWHDAEFLKS